MRGRRPKPTEIKEISGTLRKDRRNQREPKYMVLQQLPDPPESLSDRGRAIYYDTGGELLHFQLLKRVNFPLFILYCLELSRYFEAIDKLSNGNPVHDTDNGPRLNPWHRIAEDSLKSAVRIGLEFGLSPSSATKVQTKVPAADNPFKLLKDE